MILVYHAFTYLTTVEKTKMHVATMFRQNNRVRDINTIDNLVGHGYDKLYHIANGDVFEATVRDFIVPSVTPIMNRVVARHLSWGCHGLQLSAAG